MGWTLSNRARAQPKLYAFNDHEKDVNTNTIFKF